MFSGVNGFWLRSILNPPQRKLIEQNFNINDMNKHMEDLVDYVLSIGEGEQIPSNYAEIVETVLEINNSGVRYKRDSNDAQ